MHKEEVIKRLDTELWAHTRPQNISSHIIEMAYQAGADNERSIIMSRQMIPQKLSCKVELYIIKSININTGIVTTYANEAYASKDLGCNIKDIQQALRLQESFNNCYWIPDTI